MKRPLTAPLDLCPRCDGFGHVHLHGWTRCLDCNGTGINQPLANPRPERDT